MLNLDRAIIGWSEFIRREMLFDIPKKGRPRNTKITAIVRKREIKFAAVGKYAHSLAFDYSFKVPPGGFRPRRARAIVMEKPGEGIIFRARTYNRLAGQTILRRGYLSVAIDKNLKGGKGKHNIQILATGIAKHFTKDVAAQLRAHGISARAQ